MAPEFYDGVITFSLDIYSLGVIFREMLAGQKGHSSVENVKTVYNKGSKLILSTHYTRHKYFCTLQIGEAYCISYLQ